MVTLQPKTFFLFNSSSYLYPSCNRQFHYPVYFFVRAKKWNCLEITEIAAGELYHVWFLSDRVSGATGSEIHREIKWPEKCREIMAIIFVACNATRDNYKVWDATIIIEITRAKAYLMRGILCLISFVARSSHCWYVRVHFFPSRGRTHRISASFNSRLSVSKQHTASHPLGTGFCLKFKRLPRAKYHSLRQISWQSPKL